MSEAVLKVNRELMACPCCGKVLCVRCRLYQERQNGFLDAGGYDNADPIVVGVRRRYQAHLDQVDHSGVEAHG